MSARKGAPPITGDAELVAAASAFRVAKAAADEAEAALSAAKSALLALTRTARDASLISGADAPTIAVQTSEWRITVAYPARFVPASGEAGEALRASLGDLAEERRKVETSATLAELEAAAGPAAWERLAPLLSEKIEVLPSKEAWAVCARMIRAHDPRAAEVHAALWGAQWGATVRA